MQKGAVLLEAGGWSRLITHGVAVLVTVAMLAGCSQTREAGEDVEEAAGEVAEETQEVAGDVAEETEEAADVLPGVGETEFNVTLTGAAEVPGPGDPDGSGEADVTLDLEDGEVCYEISVTNVDSIAAAHIHEGAAGMAGPPVVDFNVPENGLDGCVTGVDSTLVQSILGNPSGYYVNVHNEAFPAGALRGQLQD